MHSSPPQRSSKPIPVFEKKPKSRVFERERERETAKLVRFFPSQVLTKFSHDLRTLQTIQGPLPSIFICGSTLRLGDLTETVF